MRCVRISADIGYKIGLAISYNSIGMYYDRICNFEEALKYYERYVDLSEEIGYRMGTIIGFDNIGKSFLSMGKFDMALKYFQKSFILSQELDYRIGIMRISEHLGEAYLYKKDFKPALDFLTQAMNLAKQIGDEEYLGMVTLIIAQVHALTEKFHEARMLFEQTRKIFVKRREKANLSNLYSKLAELSVMQKDCKLASKLATKAILLANQVNSSELKIIALITKGRAMLNQNPIRALAYIRQAIDIARKEPQELEVAQALNGISKELSRFNARKEDLTKISKILSAISSINWLKKF